MKIKFLISALLLSFAASAQSLDWTAQDKSFLAGESVTLDLSVSGFDTIACYQYTILFDLAALEFDSLETSGGALLLSSDDFGLSFLDEGKIRHAWSTVPYLTIPDSYVFSVRFTAIVDGSLSTFVGMEPLLVPAWAGLPPRAYKYTGLPFPNALLPIPLNFSFVDQALDSQEPVSAPTIQATPNPCPLYTTIAFDATGVTDYVLTITDMHGRVIKFASGVTTLGTNEFPADFPAAGMYIVRVVTPCGSFAEKVIAN